MLARDRAAVKLVIVLPYLKWRDGRPRWEPNARLMAEGWRGQDLRDAEGHWLDAEAARSWIEARMAEVAARRAALAAAGRRRPALRRPRLVTLADCVERWGVMIERRLADERAAGVALTLAEKTVRDYRLKARWLLRFEPELADAPVDALSPAIGRDLYQRMRLAHGDHMAAAVVRVASAMLGWACLTGLAQPLKGPPFARLRMATPPPRARAATPAEIARLVAAADALAMPDVGDAILLGVWTGQRQGDRLALQETAFAGESGRIVFRQAKTGARVAVPPAAELRARLAAARERKRALAVATRHVIVDPATGAPLPEDRYRKRFARVRAAAVAGLPEHGLPPTPTLAGFRDQDLRDTAVTWLALAGCTTEEIRAITGHERASILHILKHYIADHEGFAGAAIDKLEAWHAAEGGQTGN